MLVHDIFLGLALLQIVCENRRQKFSETALPRLAVARAPHLGECRARLAPVCDRQVHVGARRVCRARHGVDTVRK